MSTGTKYFFVRLTLMVPTLFGVTLFTFLLLHLAPGGPVEQRLGLLNSRGHQMPRTDYDRYIEQLRSHYHLDRPVVHRYLFWVRRILRLNFGESRVFRRPVADLILERAAITLRFTVFALPCCYILSLFWSLLSVSSRVKPVGVVQRMFIALLYTVPAMVVALLCRAVFDELSFVGICLSYIFIHLPITTFIFVGALDHEKAGLYTRTARAKGLGEFVILIRHVLRNAMIPVVTSLSYSLLAFCTGSLFVESVFGVDGLGGLAFLASQERDYSLLMGIVTVVSFMFIATRLFTDVLVGWVDPRIRL